MKKWLDNWTLKQEYLTSLRAGFAAHSSHFRDTLQTLKSQL
jgi:hypothetical protein